MRQVASVVKDGRVQYFIADTAEGELAEFATVMVPPSFGGAEAVKLGFNLMAAVGLNGVAAKPAPKPTLPKPAKVLSGKRTRPAVRLQWSLTNEAVLDFIREHPGCSLSDMLVLIEDENPGAPGKLRRSILSNRLLDIKRRGGSVRSEANPHAPAGEPRMRYYIE